MNIFLKSVNKMVNNLEIGDYILIKKEVNGNISIEHKQKLKVMKK